MIVLDTNVVSEVMKAAPDVRVIAWIDNLEPTETAITAITAAELLAGAERLPEGRRRGDLSQRIHRLLDVEFEGRVEPFDQAAAYEYATIRTTRERQGRPIHTADAQIASICLSLGGAALATRNIKDFADLGFELVDPWEETTATTL